MFLCLSCHSHRVVFRESSSTVFSCAVLCPFVGVCLPHTFVARCLAHHCLMHVLCTWSRCREDLIFTTRECLRLMVGTESYLSRGDHSSCCRLDTWLVCSPSGFPAALSSTLSTEHQTFHVDRPSTLVAEPVSLDGSFQARLSLGAATSMEPEGRHMGRLRA